MRLRALFIITVISSGLLISSAYGDSSLYKDTYFDTAFVHEDLVDISGPCFYNLFNMYSEAIADGVVINAARSGLGTDTPGGENLKTDGFYYQLLRIYSYFDMEIGRQLHKEMEGKCLPENVSIGAGVLSREYIDDFQKPYAENVSKIKRAMDILSPGEGQFDLVQLDRDEFPYQFETGTQFTDEFRRDLLDGILEKQLYVEETCSQNDNIQEKLKGLISSYNPLAGILSARFPQDDKSESQLSLEVYLPPFRELDIPDVDRPETWRMTNGLSKTELPKRVDISVAKLTHVGYLYEPDYYRKPVIKLELSKDYNKPHLVKTRLLFGEIDEDVVEDGLIPVRFDDYRNTLYVSFYPNVLIEPGDNFLVKNAKKMFNKAANGYQIEARIHQLTLFLEREPGLEFEELDKKDPYLKPRFSFKDSDISFRASREAMTQREARRLRLVGFVCEEKNESFGFHCHQDFGAFDGVVNYLSEEADNETQRRWWTSPSGIWKRTLNAVTRVSTKIVIDQNIRAIEDAIDLELVEVFAVLMENMDEDREKIRERLSRQFFED